MVNDYFRGRDYVVNDDEWCHVCQEVFALGAPFH